MNVFEVMAFVNSLSSAEKDRLLSLQTPQEVIDFASDYSMELTFAEAKKALTYIDKYRDR